MWQIFNALREVAPLAMMCRMLLAVFCGALIGIEREFKRRPAGFRTHILICLGAAMTTMTSQFRSWHDYCYKEPARKGANDSCRSLGYGNRRFNAWSRLL